MVVRSLVLDYQCNAGHLPESDLIVARRGDVHHSSGQTTTTTCTSSTRRHGRACSADCNECCHRPHRQRFLSERVNWPSSARGWHLSSGSGGPRSGPQTGTSATLRGRIANAPRARGTACMVQMNSARSSNFPPAGQPATAVFRLDGDVGTSAPK